jgi:hypothetical protein
MQSWKLNSIANYVLRQTIAKNLNIPLSDVYKTVEDILASNVIKTKDGKKYKLVLEEV